MFLSPRKGFYRKDNSVINYDKDLLSLVLFAGVFNKASHNPFRKKYFLLLKIVLAKQKSSDPHHCVESLRDVSQHSLCKWLSGGIEGNVTSRAVAGSSYFVRPALSEGLHALRGLLTEVSHVARIILQYLSPLLY